MNEIASFLIGVFITVSTSVAVVVYLRPHLRKILIDLCQTEDRADFWGAFANVTVVLTPLICAMFQRPTGRGGSAAFFDVSTQLQWSFIGLIGAVFVMGAVIAHFIPSTTRA